MKSKVFKYSLITEGKMERILFNWLKDSIYNRKDLSLCKEHSCVDEGTLNDRLIKNKSNDCCNKYFIFDVDDIEKVVLEKHIIKAKKEKVMLIINNPCLEIVLLSFFKYCDQEKIDKKWIEEKINKELKKLGWVKYKHDIKSLGEILEKLSKSKKHKENFKKNLLKYKKRTINPCSNFIDLIKILEGKNNG